MTDSITDIKKKRFTEALENYSKVYLHFVTGEEGVQIPHHLYDQEVVVFVYGYDLPIPITDLDIDSEGVGATLSFGGSPFYCFVPWKAVLMISTDTGEAWPLPDRDHIDVLIGYLMDRLDSKGQSTSTEHLDDGASRSSASSMAEDEDPEDEESVKLLLLDRSESDEIDRHEDDSGEEDAGSDDDDTPRGPPTLRIIT